LSKAILLLETLNQELDSIIKNMFDEERKHLTDLEVKHLIKMTDYVVMKIKQQRKVASYEHM
jgi:hypothetical protein